MITAEELLRWAIDIGSWPNSQVSPAEKWTLFFARLELEWIGHGPDREHRTTIYLDNIAKRSGLSSQTVGNNLKVLSQKGIIEREVYVQGFEKKRVAIAFPEQLIKQPRRMLASIGLPERNHGGKRIAGFQCRYCGAIGFQMKAGYGCICQNTQCEEVGVVQFYASDSTYLLTEDQMEG